MDLHFNGHFIELMAINMKINDLTHKTIIFKWGGRVGLGGQSGCEQCIEVFVKIQKKNFFFFFGGGGGGGGVGGGVRVDVNVELKFL